MKKVISLVLAGLMLLSLCACDLTGGALAGTWKMEVAQDAQDTKELLESFNFYEEEIALVDLDAQKLVMVLRLNEDKSYSWYYDEDAARANVRDFYEGVFEDLYAGREQLSQVYEVDLTVMTQDEFNAFYADMFSQSSVEAMFDLLVEESYYYDRLSEPFETGTYRVSFDKIYMTVSGETDEEYVSFKQEGETLTLTFEDSVEVYTKD